MKYLKSISLTFILALTAASLISLYIILEPYDFNPFEYSRSQSDKYMMLAPLFLFLIICSLIFNINKFKSLKFIKGTFLKIFRVIDILFSIVLIVTAILLIFLTDAIPQGNTFAISFFSCILLLSIINLIDGLKFSND